VLPTQLVSPTSIRLSCAPSLRIGLTIRETDMIHARTIPAESGHDGRSGGYFHQGGCKGAPAIFYTILVRLGTGAISPLVAIDYLRCERPLVSTKNSSNQFRLDSTYASAAWSLNSRRMHHVYYMTFYHYLRRLAWLYDIYVYTHGLLETHSSWLSVGFIWQGIGAFLTNISSVLLNFPAATTAIALCSNSAFPLYASLKCTSPPSPRPKRLDHANAILTLIRRNHFIPPSIYNLPKHHAVVSYPPSHSFRVFM